MIFAVLETEGVVQVGDTTRLNAVKSFVSKNEPSITRVEIKPEQTADWIDVTGSSPQDWFLDWSYAGSSRTVVPSVRVTTDPGDDQAQPAILPSQSTITQPLMVLTAQDDNLFSNDQDLMALEPDILRYTPDGRSSFLNVHRLAQTKIVETLNEQGLTTRAGEDLTKASIVNLSEVRAWSRDLTLYLIFSGLMNAVDDVFSIKAKRYAQEVTMRQGRATLRLDLNGDGLISNSEKVWSVTSADLVRR